MYLTIGEPANSCPVVLPFVQAQQEAPQNQQRKHVERAGGPGGNGVHAVVVAGVVLEAPNNCGARVAKNSVLQMGAPLNVCAGEPTRNREREAPHVCRLVLGTNNLCPFKESTPNQHIIKKDLASVE